MREQKGRLRRLRKFTGEDISLLEKMFGVVSGVVAVGDFLMNFFHKYGNYILTFIFIGLYIYSLYRRITLSNKINHYFEEFFYLKTIKRLSDGTIVAEGDIANFLTEGSLLDMVRIERDKDGKKIELPLGKARVKFIQSDRYIVHIEPLSDLSDFKDREIYFKPIFSGQREEFYGSQSY